MGDKKGNVILSADRGNYIVLEYARGESDLKHSKEKLEKLVVLPICRRQMEPLKSKETLNDQRQKLEEEKQRNP